MKNMLMEKVSYGSVLVFWEYFYPFEKVDLNEMLFPQLSSFLQVGRWPLMPKHSNFRLISMEYSATLSWLQVSLG